MTYKEAIEKATSLDFIVETKGNKITFHRGIPEWENYVRTDTVGQAYIKTTVLKLAEMLLTLARTPLSERGNEEKFYRVPIEEKILARSATSEINLVYTTQLNQFYKTEFTEKEINEINPNLMKIAIEVDN